MSITDPEHPWVDHSGEITSAPEKYGLGWYGQRLKLDGNAWECYVRPGQTNGTPRGKKLDGAAVAAKFIGSIPDEGDAKKPGKDAPKYTPTETERADARRLFREIGQRFNQNRKKSKTAAYTAYRHDLMENMDTLIMGGATDLKEITMMITNLEQYTRETEQESTETPATILGRWLRMDAAEIAELEKGSVAAAEPGEEEPDEAEGEEGDEEEESEEESEESEETEQFLPHAP